MSIFDVLKRQRLRVVDMIAESAWGGDENIQATTKPAEGTMLPDEMLYRHGYLFFLVVSV